ncbi:hypothetical protein AUK10_02260 [Candidatus Gracilibacteria bacterium CG2_30_37_12]|nr:MAG: hypothetical protein AUK10_02260 [Candidatus Gracilibacteria bacterium CG2_30_37_12]
MRFQQELYHYQDDILAVFESEKARGDKKIHIVAPPGSGKTIVGLEMITRLDTPTLILVPNITLQFQWKDKLEKLFLESGETIESLVSTEIQSIRKINIITYQSLTTTGGEDDIIMVKIYDLWFGDFSGEFLERKDFEEFIQNLKESNSQEYSDTVGVYKKKLKLDTTEGMLEKLLSEKAKTYFLELGVNNIGAIVVDEAHHLTAWWSRVVYHLWEILENPYIIGLTATPPFDNVDFFDLDDSYAKLLGEVDYYIPTPAIIKSGRLAPYNDLVQFVEPGKDLQDILDAKEKLLNVFLETERVSIAKHIFSIVEEESEKLLKNNPELLDSYLRFIYHSAPELDISEYITENTIEPIILEDIAKSTGKWLMNKKIKDSKSDNQTPVKSLFFDLGYIWRGSNFFRFQTPIEKLLIYSKSKIEAVKIILRKERENLGSELRSTIITDFLSADSDYINCQYIFEELKTEFSDLNPYLISGQGIWKIGANGETELLLNETTLSVTEKLMKGEIRLLIGTRGILGEGWDCPKLNTLIDLTGIVAYMSVNQVRGRAIRLDRDNLHKTANIYDIVCIGEGYQGMKDFTRLENKHEKFYGVNDAGMVVKGVDHIYPNLRVHLCDRIKINENMLKRSSFRDAIYDLWGVGKEYANKETFGLHLEVRDAFRIFPLIPLPFGSMGNIRTMFQETSVLKYMGQSYYFAIIEKFLSRFIQAIMQVLQENKILPADFIYNLKRDEQGNFKLTSTYKDDLVSKAFMLHISQIFSPITKQKYVLEVPMRQLENDTWSDNILTVGLPDVLSKNKKYRETLETSLLKFLFGNTEDEMKIQIELNNKNQQYNFLIKMSNILWIIVWFIFISMNISTFNAFENGTRLLFYFIFSGGLIYSFYLFFKLNILINIRSGKDITIIGGEIRLASTIICILIVVGYFILPMPYINNYLEGIPLIVLLLLVLGLLQTGIFIGVRVYIQGYIRKIFSPIWMKYFIQTDIFYLKKQSLDIIYLNDPEIDKRAYISKTPFIISKIEKLWI